MGVDVLNLEWSSRGRDRESANLICSALRRMGFTVAEESIFNYPWALAKHRPKVLYCADPKGAAINFKVVALAQRMGLPVVTFTAEGVYREPFIRDMFWGHIKPPKLLEYYNLQWSQSARDLAVRYFPEVASATPVVGAVGFDRYFIYKFATPSQWQAKYGKAFKPTVGIAGGGLDGLFYRDTSYYRACVDAYGEAQLERYRQDHLASKAAYAQLVEHFPQITFVLKEHPATVSRQTSEFSELDTMPNVVLLRNEESISDCLSVSDLWLAYDSTTCMEGWLLGKPTALYNPSGADFVRDQTHLGSVIVTSAAALEDLVRDFFGAHELAGFSALAEQRQKIIQSIMQWSDGKNHLRAAKYMADVIGQTRATNTAVDWSKLLSMENGRALARHARQRWFRRADSLGSPIFERADFTQFYALHGAELDQFQADHPLTNADLAELERINPVVRR